jgi:hypothetical protein
VPFVIDGQGATLDGSAPLPGEAWEHYRGATFRARPPRLGPQQLFLDDRPATLVPADPGAAVPPKLEPLEWSDHGGFLYFCVEKDKLPADYALTCAGLPTGITLYHVTGVVIGDLTVQGFQTDGLAAANSARDVQLQAVVARGNARAGVSVGGASQVRITKSVLGNNGRAQLLTQPHSTTWVRQSDLYANTAPARVDRGGRFYLDGERREGHLNDDVLALPADDAAADDAAANGAAAPDGQ